VFVLVYHSREEICFLYFCEIKCKNANGIEWNGMEWNGMESDDDGRWNEKMKINERKMSKKYTRLS
jgi:hypothetical protein